MGAIALVVSAAVTLIAYLVLRGRQPTDVALKSVVVTIIGIVSVLAIVGGTVFMALHEFFKWGIL